MQRFQAEPREYVKVTLHEGRDEPIGDVAVKLKGAAGSFRPWDERPALTVIVHKSRNGNRFHDLGRFHLNNSV